MNNNIIKKNREGKKYLKFINAGKKWIINYEKIDEGMDMYQPSTSKGKKGKLLIKKIPSLAYKKGIVSFEKYSINEEIIDKIKEIYGINDCYLSFYEGDCSTWQNDKITIQVVYHNEIVGYVKITNNNNVNKLFENEVNIIKKLQDADFKNISNIVYYGKIGEYYCLAQDTNKIKAKNIKFSFDRNILELIKNMTENTISETTYEKSDIFEYIQYMKTLEHKGYKSDVIKKAIEFVESQLDEVKLEYSVSHGDFTPWNLYEDYKVPFIIDFEYGHEKMPRYIDVFHYMTQYVFLAKNADVGSAVALFRNRRKMLCDYIGHPELIYSMYLIYIICFYFKRNNGCLEDDIYRKRVELLEYIITRKVNNN